MRRKIFHDLSGDAKEVDKLEFDRVVQELRDKLRN